MSEWKNKMKELASKVKNERVLFFASTGTMVQMADRVWGRGELTNGSKVAYNEDYEVHIYKPPFPRAPKGKGKNGAKIKGEWAPTWLAAKTSQGRGGTPFELTGDLRIAWLGGPRPTPRERDPLVCEIAMDEKNAEKAKGLAEMKGEFLKLSARERDEHHERIRKEYRKRVLGQ
jgi:hypothetical protein